MEEGGGSEGNGVAALGENTSRDERTLQRNTPGFSVAQPCFVVS